jgi:hypothetical protein
VAAADLWPLIPILGIGELVVARIAYCLGEHAQARRQRLSRRHLVSSHVVVHRPATAPEARLALAAANEASTTTGPLYNLAADQ